LNPQCRPARLTTAVPRVHPAMEVTPHASLPLFPLPGSLVLSPPPRRPLVLLPEVRAGGAGSGRPAGSMVPAGYSAAAPRLGLDDLRPVGRRGRALLPAQLAGGRVRPPAHGYHRGGGLLVGVGLHGSPWLRRGHALVTLDSDQLPGYNVGSP